MVITPITPITAVKVLRSVPLDSTYTDTFGKGFFPNVSAQVAYFTSKAKYTYTDLSPVRLQNVLRLPVVADDIFDCNYIMFQNANFGQKWFYAFIDEINYVNPSCCEVSFTLDVMQTWLFDYTIHPSFVEREHIQNDGIGMNIVAENLELGDYVYNGSNAPGFQIDTIPAFNDGKRIVVACSVNADNTPAVGAMYSGVYSGIKFNVFSTAEDVNNFLSSLTADNKSNAVVSIFMFYESFISQTPFPVTKTYTFNKVTDNIDGYVPKNNKLFTYPYNFLRLSTGGTSASYRYEYFSDNVCNFSATGVTTCNPSITVSPIGYKRLDGPFGGAQGASNYPESITTTNFPQCAYTIDAFRAWVAQQGGSAAVASNVVAGVTGSIASIASGNPLGVISGAANIAGQLAQVKATAELPPQAHGSSNNNALFALGAGNIVVMPLSINVEYAEIIDNYFSMYGYATHKVKVPNVTGRPSWNYVKTVGVKLTGSIPFDDMNKIKSVYDNGVTFWHGDWIGDYNRANK